MADPMEISVNFRTLEKCENDLSNLASAVRTRKLTTTLTTARGATADQVTAVITEMGELGAALAELINQTRCAVTRTRIGFTDMDEKLAKWFGVMEE